MSLLRCSAGENGALVMARVIPEEFVLGVCRQPETAGWPIDIRFVALDIDWPFGRRFYRVHPYIQAGMFMGASFREHCWRTLNWPDGMAGRLSV